MSLVAVWFKLKKSLSGKMVLGGFGGGAKTGGENYI